MEDLLRVGFGTEGVIPLGVTPQALACRGAEALVLGAVSDDVGPEDPRFLSTDVVALRFRSDPAPARPVLTGRLSLGSGFIIAASQPDASTVVALLGDWNPEDERQTRLMVSPDMGATWAVMPAPPGILEGLAFASARSGFAWTWTKLHHTDDGGVTWSTMEPPVTIGQGAAPADVDLDGALWIGLGRDATCVGIGFRHLYRITRDLRVDGSVTLDGRCIGALDVDPDGSTWIATSSHGKEVISIEEVVTGPQWRLRAVRSSLASGLPAVLKVRGRRMLLLHVRVDVSMSSVWERLLVSHDAGRTWKGVRHWSRRVGVLCQCADEGDWVANGTGHLARLDGRSRR